MFKNSNQLISEFFSTSVEETKQIGKNLVKDFKNIHVIAFLGNLGCGKTSIIKGIVSALNNTKEDDVCSPTFTYLNIYPGNPDIFHFDLYRIKNEDQFLAMGFDEYFYKDGICLIEWSEKITSLLPENTIAVHLIENENENETKITVLDL